VQATPLGRLGEEVIPAEALAGRGVVLDVVYAPRPTPLRLAAAAHGVAALSGFDLLLAQAALQFRILTGRDADLDAMAAAGRSWWTGRGQDAAWDAAAP
jgi:shikimate dehydrogenase